MPETILRQLRALWIDEIDCILRVTPRVNQPFPWMAGSAMWPFMIAALPPLPADVEYRFVGRDLVLLVVSEMVPNAVQQGDGPVRVALTRSTHSTSA